MGKRKSRITQHKETNEKSEVKKARELRAENQKLKRQISRMRKEISKGLPPEPDYDEPLLEIVAPKPTTPGCCDEPDLTTVHLGVKTLIVCKNCKFRKTENKND